MRLLTAIVLASATFCFALGITLPLMEVRRLFVLSDHPSLIGIASSLWATGDYLLALVITLFSIVFPAFKLMLLHAAAMALPGAPFHVPRLLRSLSNWSMLDVVLVALVVFTAKNSGVATALTRPGLWFFAASVVLTVAAAALVRAQQETSGS